MHVLAGLIVVLILMLAVGVGVVAVNASGGKMIAALAGRSVLAVSLSDVRRVPVGQKNCDSSVNLRRFPQIAANDAVQDLALAA